MFVCISMCIKVCVYVCMFVNVCICGFVCISVCVHAHMCRCVDAVTQAWPKSERTTLSIGLHLYLVGDGVSDCSLLCMAG